MKKYMMAVCCLLSIHTFAQKKNKTAEKFSQTILADDLKNHLYILAAPDMEGRETGTAGQRKAAEYLKQQFAKIGLTPGNNGSYEQFYPFYKDTLKESQLIINGKQNEFGKDFTLSPTSFVNSKISASEILYSSANDTVTLIKEKVVLIKDGLYTPADLLKLFKREPKLILFLQSDFEKYASVAERTSRMYFRKPVNNRTIVPVLRISNELGKLIVKDDWASLTDKTLTSKSYASDLQLNITTETLTIIASNVLGMIEGTDKKDEWVIISAHYDHIGMNNGVVNPGADDDGSGTVGLLELAEAFAKAKAAGKGPRRNILFLSVSGEEKGLWGSEYYSNHPVYALDKTSLDINIDMIGRKDDKLNSIDSNNHVYLIGDDKLSSELPKYVDSINNLYIKLITDRKYNDPNDPNRLYFRSDHYNFARKGVPIIFFFDGIHKDYHKPADTPDKINYDLYEKRTRLVFFLAWEAANRNALFVRDKPLADVPTR
ncbi:MAG: M28 family peptidase [Chitinophagaceae bacterium]|nr:M28 family peptidase [Chitinophagaceae bacterium]